MTDKSPPPADRAVYRSALRATLVLLAVAAAVGASLGYVLAGAPGLVGSLAGVGVAAVAGLVTQGAMLTAVGRPAHVVGAIVAGAWLGKMIVIVIALAALAAVDGFHRAAFGWTVIALVVATLAIDFWAVRRTDVPYVEPGSSPAP